MVTTFLGELMFEKGKKKYMPEHFF